MMYQDCEQLRKVIHLQLQNAQNQIRHVKAEAEKNPQTLQLLKQFTLKVKALNGVILKLRTINTKPKQDLSNLPSLISYARYEHLQKLFKRVSLSNLKASNIIASGLCNAKGAKQNQEFVLNTTQRNKVNRLLQQSVKDETELKDIFN